METQNLNNQESLVSQAPVEDGQNVVSEPAEDIQRPAEKKQFMANMIQVAVLNKMLPKGYKFQLTDRLKQKSGDLGKASKKAAQSLAHNASSDVNGTGQARGQVAGTGKHYKNLDTLSFPLQPQTSSSEQTPPLADNSCLSCYPYTFTQEQLAAAHNVRSQNSSDDSDEESDPATRLC